MHLVLVSQLVKLLSTTSHGLPQQMVFHRHMICFLLLFLLLAHKQIWRHRVFGINLMNNSHLTDDAQMFYEIKMVGLIL